MEELQAALHLGVFLEASTRLPWCSKVLMSDSSPSRGAVIATDASIDLNEDSENQHANDSEGTLTHGKSTDASTSYLQIHVLFGRQRFQSDPVPAIVDPNFDENFLLELPAPASTPKAALAEEGSSVDLGRAELRSLLHGGSERLS